jgi:hypothetical protein
VDARRAAVPFVDPARFDDPYAESGALPPVLPICDGADRLWPACAFADAIAERAPQTVALAYRAAGHAFVGMQLQGASAPGVAERMRAAGGTAEANAAAAADAFGRALAFVERRRHRAPADVQLTSSPAAAARRTPAAPGAVTNTATRPAATTADPAQSDTAEPAPPHTPPTRHSRIHRRPGTAAHSDTSTRALPLSSSLADRVTSRRERPARPLPCEALGVGLAARA